MAAPTADVPAPPRQNPIAGGNAPAPRWRYQRRPPDAPPLPRARRVPLRRAQSEGSLRSSRPEDPVTPTPARPFPPLLQSDFTRASPSDHPKAPHLARPFDLDSPQHAFSPLRMLQARIEEYRAEVAEAKEKVERERSEAERRVKEAKEEGDARVKEAREMGEARVKEAREMGEARAMQAEERAKKAEERADGAVREAEARWERLLTLLRG